MAQFLSYAQVRDLVIELYYIEDYFFCLDACRAARCDRFMAPFRKRPQ